MFSWGRWVLRGASMWSSRSSWFAAFIEVRSGCRWDHPGSLGSLGSSLGLIGFILCCRVHWNAPWVSSCSFRVVGFIGGRIGVC